MYTLNDVKEALFLTNKYQKLLTSLEMSLKSIYSERDKIFSEINAISPSYFEYDAWKDGAEQRSVSLEDYIKHLESSEQSDIKHYKSTLIETLKGLNSFYNSKLEVIENKIEELKNKINETKKTLRELLKKYYSENIFQLSLISKKSFNFTEKEINFIESFEFFYQDKKRIYILTNRDIKTEINEFSETLKSRLNMIYLLNSRFSDRLLVQLNLKLT